VSEDLPEGWVRLPLREVAEVRLGRQRSPDRAKGDHMRPYMRAANVTWQGISLEDVKEMDFSPNELETYRLRDGDILLSEASGSATEVGKPAIWRDQVQDCCFQNTLIRVRSRGPLPEYLHLHFLADARLGRFAVAGKGVGINHLGADRMASWPTALPPLNEQHRIVAKLEALQTRSRRAREALDAVQPLLERLRQSILAAAFRGDLTKDWRAKNKNVEPATKLLERIRAERRQKWEQAELAKLKAKGKAPADDKWKSKYKEPTPIDPSGLPKLPPGWCWAKASDVVAPDTVISYGIVLPGPPLDDGIPYVRGQDIEDGRILVDQLWHTSPEIAAAHSRSELAEGDVLLCIIRHLKVAIVPSGLDGGNVTQGTVRMRPSSAILGSYLARFLEGPSAQGWMKARYFGNAMPRINVEDAREIPLPVPPVEEQHAIALAVSKRLEAVGRALNAAANCAERQVALERAVLAKAFRGDLVPQDPNDEPADARLAPGDTSDMDDANSHAKKTKRPTKKRSPPGDGTSQHPERAT
jgi:type I restriction enzyme S subunit